MMSYFPNVKADLASARCLNFKAVKDRMKTGKTRTNPARAAKGLPKVDLLGSSTKVAHSLREGWENAVMYLAPHSRAEGADMCLMAGECKKGCLTSAGQLGMTGAEISKVFKTRAYQADQNLFLNLLIADIARFLGSIKRKERGYKAKGSLPSSATLMPTVRLNGTSDEPWEIIPVRILPELIETLTGLRVSLLGPNAARSGKHPYLDQSIEAGAVYRNIFDVFPGLQFYDYTKYRIRARYAEYHAAYGNVHWPKNYHLTYSLSEQARSEDWAWEALKDGHSVAAVFNTKVAEVEAYRRVLEHLPPESETQASLMKRLKAQGRPYPWQVLPCSVVINGERVGVSNADVTDLRFKDGTAYGKGKIAWLSAKGDAIRDCTGFVRDYATLKNPLFARYKKGKDGEFVASCPQSPEQANTQIDVSCARALREDGTVVPYEFGCPINNPEPWTRLGMEGGCRQHLANEDAPISGEPTVESPHGSRTMKFPYMTWEQALVTGRPARTRSPFDKPLTKNEKKKGSPAYPAKIILPRLDWKRVLVFVGRGGCVYGGSLEGLIITVLTGAPNLYQGRLAMVEKNKWAISQELINDVYFILEEGVSASGLALHLVQRKSQDLVYHDIFISEQGHAACPPAEGWRTEFKKTRRAHAQSMVPRVNPKRRMLKRKIIIGVH
jgi:hypothetical protein